MPGPRLGLFWALPVLGAAWDIEAVMQQFAEVPDIGGFRTLEAGHVEVWPVVRRRCDPVPPGQYEDYPRGRVNWREEDRRFLLLLDASLLRPLWTGKLIKVFDLPIEDTLIMTDPHYRSRFRPPRAPQADR